MPPEKEETIVFLCPNGHRLNGPAHLQGKPGQCPHCGEKFHIPDFEEVSPHVEADLSAADVPVGMPMDEEDILEVVEIDEISEEVEIIDEVPQEPQEAAITEVAAAKPIVAKSSAPADSTHTMAGLVAKFWRQKNEKNDFELHLSDGNILAPKFFYPELSNQECGVFADDEKGKATNLHLVPWKTIVRVRITNVTELPEQQ